MHVGNPSSLQRSYVKYDTHIYDSVFIREISIDRHEDSKIQSKTLMSNPRSKLSSEQAETYLALRYINMGKKRQVDFIDCRENRCISLGINLSMESFRCEWPEDLCFQRFEFLLSSRARFDLDSPDILLLIFVKLMICRSLRMNS